MIPWHSFQSYFQWFLAPSAMLFLTTVSIFKEVAWPITTVSQSLSKVFINYWDFIFLEFEQANSNNRLFIYAYMHMYLTAVVGTEYIIFCTFSLPFVFQVGGGPTTTCSLDRSPVPLLYFGCNDKLQKMNLFYSPVSH